MLLQAPERDVKAFTCPHCRAFTQQSWFLISARPTDSAPSYIQPNALRTLAEKTEAESSETAEHFREIADVVEKGDPGLQKSWLHEGTRSLANMAMSVCYVCKRETLWIGDNIIHPRIAVDAPEPNQDLGEELKRDYREASQVLTHSPRSACALLRLLIQKLCSDISGKPGDVNSLIGDLVKEGLPRRVQQALDIVRVIGNEAVHPGVLDLKDDHRTALNLFILVNLTAESLISQPRHVDALYAGLPESKLQGIAQSDNRKK